MKLFYCSQGDFLKLFLDFLFPSLKQVVVLLKFTVNRELTVSVTEARGTKLVLVESQTCWRERVENFA